MVQLSEKELSWLNDALSEEDLLVKKFQKLANEADDSEIKSKFTEIAAKHQGHFNELYAHLK
jgi:rubrerythrin